MKLILFLILLFVVTVGIYNLDGVGNSNAPSDPIDRLEGSTDAHTTPATPLEPQDPTYRPGGFGRGTPPPG